MGLGGSLTSILAPTITGASFESDWPSAIVAGDPAGISVSFNPVAWQGAPPTSPFTMTITVTAAVPVGTYTITVNDTLLPPDQGCSGSCVQPTYTLEVDPGGTPDISVQVPLQDNVKISDSNVPPETATLSDAVKVGDAYVAPAIAALSDVVGVVDKYVAPVTASLSDALHAVDSYVSPVTAALSDALSFLDQLVNPSPAQAAGLAAIGLVSLASVSLVVRKKRSKKR